MDHGKEHRPESFLKPFAALDEYRTLLDVIGWEEPQTQEPISLDLNSALRFTAYAKRRYVSLGPVTKAEAERELRHVLADVERGIWRPARVADAPPEPEPLPTFHEYAEDWWLRHECHLRQKTQSDYPWRLEKHLLPFFKDYALGQITFDTVERYIAAELAEADPLSARSINMTVILLGAILEGAR